MCTNLGVGSRPDEQLSDDNPVPAVLAVASEEVFVLFLRPPARVSWRFASRRKDEYGESATRDTINAL